MTDNKHGGAAFPQDEPTQEVPSRYDPMTASYMLMRVVQKATEAAAKSFAAYERDDDEPSHWTSHALRLIDSIEGDLKHARKKLSAREAGE